jgi:hypothetical protein
MLSAMLPNVRENECYGPAIIGLFFQYKESCALCKLRHDSYDLEAGSPRNPDATQQHGDENLWRVQRPRRRSLSGLN